jgi:hypothetical protein
MRSSQLLAAAFLLLASPAVAQDAAPEAETGFVENDIAETEIAEPEFNCAQDNLPAELAQLCFGLDDGLRDAMSRPAELQGKGRPEIRPSLVRRPVSQELTGRGLTPAQPDLRKDPFTGAEDRGLGVRMRADGTPVQFSTEMVQPGQDGNTLLNWELRAEHAPEQSGLFFGGATAGTYDPNNRTNETLSGFAGLRGVAKPADNVQIGAEIAPRFGSDFAFQTGSLALEPKLTAKSDLGRLGTSDFTGTINADAAYSVPVTGDPSAWGGVRFTVKPK